MGGQCGEGCLAAGGLKEDKVRGGSRGPHVARKGLQLTSMAMPVLTSPQEQRGSGVSLAVLSLSFH